MIIYCKIQDHGYFCICTNGIVGRGKSNQASNNVKDIDFPIVFVSITSKDSEVLLTPTNEISHSKEALILYGCIQRWIYD